VVTWDDHEVDNNYAGEIPEEKGPMTREDFLTRRAAAYQAYYEHMPLRASCVPKGPGMQLYRSVRHGRLVDFQVLDTRQFRSDQPNQDRPGPASLDPQATMLGSAQREWLLGELKNSRATWNVLAQQVMMARVDRDRGPEEKCSMDQWPGYEAERQGLLRAFQELNVSNPVVLTGDIHTHWANELPLVPTQSDAPIVGTEFVCTSITSKGDGTAHPAGLEGMLSDNPFVKYHSDQRGYVSCRIDGKCWHSDFRTVDYVTRPGAPLVTSASFVVESGRNALLKA
jgi:alkaline phosphatase D